MTVLYGLEVWNRPDLGLPLEWERVTTLGGYAAKLRAYHSPELVDRYLALWPDCLFLLRRSADGWPTVAQVEEIRSLVEHIQRRGGRAIYLVDSEPNLGGTALTDAYRRALGEVVVALDTAYPDLPLCSPPMAVQQRDLEWLAALEADFCLWGLEYRAGHLYWQWGEYSSPDWGRRMERYAEVCPGARWIVDEVGDATPAGQKSESERADAVGDVLAYLRGRGDVEAATVFLAGGTPDWALFHLPPEQLARVRERLEEEESMPESHTSIGGLEVIDLRGALPHNGEYATRDMSEVQFLTIHHSGVAVDSTAFSIAQYHVSSLGWPGIGYTCLVHQDGRIELCNDLDRMSYHVASRNRECLGICLPGDFTTVRPPLPQVEATRKLIQALWVELGRDVPVVGHRDIALAGSPTSCPGDTWPSWKLALTPEPWPVPTPIPTPGPEPEPAQPDLLALLDALWARAAALDGLAAEVKAEAQAVRDYIIMVKQAAGLEKGA